MLSNQRVKRNEVQAPGIGRYREEESEGYDSYDGG